MNTNFSEHSILGRIQNWFRLFPMKVLDALAMALLFAAGAVSFAGLVALAFQAQFWFDHGAWQPLTVFAAVYRFLPAPFLHWVFDPTDWVSVATAVQHFLSWSLWWVLLLFSIPILYGALAIDKTCHKRKLRYHRTRQNKLLEDEDEGWLTAKTD